MKAVKAWAVVMDSGRIRDLEGLCVFASKTEAAKYADGRTIIRVEIRPAAGGKSKP